MDVDDNQVAPRVTASRVVLPGDVIEEAMMSDGDEKDGGGGNIRSSKRVALGPGLRKDVDGEGVVAMKAGLLRQKKSSAFWVDTRQKRYVPVKGEPVLGVVTTKAGEIYRVDINGSIPATVSYLAFDGATKRNRPDVKVGDLLFAKVVAAGRDMEPELVCIDALGHANGMGVIRDGGTVLNCSLNLCRKIVSPQCDLMRELGKHMPFEVTAGMNGRIWLKGRSTKETLVIANCVKNAELMTNDEIRVIVQRAVNVMAGF